MRFLFGILSLFFATALAAAPQQSGTTVEGSPEGAVVADGEKPASVSTSDEELQQFAEAYKKIVVIRTTVGPELKALKKESEKKALKKEAGKEMRKAIQDTGLSVQRFNAIIQKLDNNPELRKRFSALMKKQ